MGGKEKLLGALTSHWDLPDAALPGVPLVEVAGQRRVLIENHGGIVEYGSCRITVVVDYGWVVVTGSCLHLARMTREQLVICGKIEAISLMGRGR